MAALGLKVVGHEPSPSDTVAATPGPDSKLEPSLNDIHFAYFLENGIFGQLTLIQMKTSKKLYACKMVKKAIVVENNEIECLRREKRVLLLVTKHEHPFICHLKAVFQTPTSIYIVTEYLHGGNLMYHLQREIFNTQQTRFYASELCLALKFLHENGILYRNLKLDNILLGLDGHIKLTGFEGVKDEIWHDSKTGSFIGNTEFMAPEILLDKPYGHAVDWWGFGIIIYQMAFSKPPFAGQDADEIYDYILDSEPLYPPDASEELVSLIQGLLTKDPGVRLGSGTNGALDIMNHAWFEDIDWEEVEHKKRPPPFLPKVATDTYVSNCETEQTGTVAALTPLEDELGATIQNEFRDFSFVADDL